MTIKAENLTSSLCSIWNMLPVIRKYQFILLMFLTVVASFFELVSLSSLYPFISSIVSGQVITKTNIIHIIPWFQNATVHFFLLVFIFSSLISGVLRVFLIWFSLRVSNMSGSELGANLYEAALYESYVVHVRRNSSEIISALTQKISAVTATLNSVVAVITASVILIGILFALFSIDTLVTILVLMVFGLAYFGIAISTREKLLKNSRISNIEQTHMVRCIQEGLGSIRHVILDGLQDFYSSRYRQSAFRLQNAMFQNSFISQAPRFLMETLAILLVGIIFLVSEKNNINTKSLVPIIATFAMGAQRLLPILQQIYGNLTVIFGNKAFLDDFAGLVNKTYKTAKLKDQAYFQKSFNLTGGIVVKSLRFFRGKTTVLKSVNINIEKGQMVGIIGPTGSGKTTLIDILTGLLEPSEGMIFVGGHKLSGSIKKEWRKAIAYVPQSIFLVDGTIAENIALGVPFNKIDFDLISEVGRISLLDDFIKLRPDGYYERVGEDGSWLSGGQKQRIGIARALYKRASYIILDEATSALDPETEGRLIKNLNEIIGATIIMVAHRASALKYCHKIYKIDRGVALEVFVPVL